MLEISFFGFSTSLGGVLSRFFGRPTGRLDGRGRGGTEVDEEGFGAISFSTLFRFSAVFLALTLGLPLGSLEDPFRLLTFVGKDNASCRCVRPVRVRVDCRVTRDMALQIVYSVYIYVCMYVYMYACMHVRIVYVYVCMYVVVLETHVEGCIIIWETVNQMYTDRQSVFGDF